MCVNADCLNICDLKEGAEGFLVNYIRLKGSIVGPMFKAPFIGPFLESVNPDFRKYKAKWASGDLSCVSVFHKCGPPSLSCPTPY